jgi:hypothetical protein
MIISLPVEGSIVAGSQQWFVYWLNLRNNTACLEMLEDVDFAAMGFMLYFLLKGLASWLNFREHISTF